MGIPGFFAFIKKHKGIIKASIVSPESPELKQHLFLDFNGAIYTVLKDNASSIKTQESLIINVLGYLDTLARVYPNLALLYIAIDGVPPRAKIEQQRARRFNNTKESELVANLHNPDNQTTESFDTNMITPGTPFMYNLCISIREHISTSPIYSAINVIFSGADDPLEGEHKILQYIRHHSQDYSPQEDQIIIYGLDADLIMLAISMHLPNIYLLREKTEYGQYAMVFEGHQYLHLDIDSLKECVVREFEHYIGDIQMTEINLFLDDYILLCFLLGNDFIAKVPWLNIKNGGHDILLSSFARMYNMHYMHLFDGQIAKVNTKAFYYLIEILQSMEDQQMGELYQYRSRARPNMSKVSNEYERQRQLITQMPLLHLEEEMSIGYNKPTWRNQYYPVCFHHKQTTSNIENIVIQYLESLIWSAKYYYRELPSWSWFYPFHYAPSFRDIFQFLQKMETTYTASLSGIGLDEEPWKFAYLRNNVNNVVFTKHRPIKPLELLLMVLPIKSSKYLPAEIQNLLVPEVSAIELKPYFPKKYKVCVAFHSYTWECKPVIPVINYNNIRTVFSRINLSTSEKKRNVVGNEFRKLAVKNT